MILPRTVVWAMLGFSLCGINVVLSSTTLSAQTLAQTIQGEEPPRLPPEPIPIMQELDLSREQFEQLAAIRNRYREQIIQTDEELYQAEQELEELMGSPTATESEVREKFRQVELLRQRLAELTFESSLEMRSVLRPDQRRAFLERF